MKTSTAPDAIPPETRTLEAQIKFHAEKAVLKFITDGGWLVPDYQNRVTVPAGLLQGAWALVDQEAVKRRLKERIETELADRLMNHMAAEMATDVKQILSVPERREAIRQIAREHLESIMQKGLTP